MLQSTAFVILAMFWASLYLLDSFIKTNRRLAPVAAALSRTGITFHLAQVRYYTTRFNRSLVNIGMYRPRLLRAWFDGGVVFGCVAMAMSMLLLTVTVVNMLSRQPTEQQILVPVMPGVNLPTSQIIYYLLTLFICAVFHEFGHAVAAVREQVHVKGFGVFFLVLYPGAFVDMATDQLLSLSAWQQLRIFCAGVWHNFVIVVFALLILVSLPSLLSPFYVSGQSVLVTALTENSALSGARGVSVGDELTAVDDCTLKSIAQWTDCVRELMSQRQRGYCLAMAQLQQLDISWTQQPVAGVDCCVNSTDTHLCFRYRRKHYSMFESVACLPGRLTSQQARCHVTSDCLSALSVCVTPTTDNVTRLVSISRLNQPDVIFLGHPLDLYHSVYLSDFVPRMSVFPANLHYIVDTLCRYLVSLSGALAVLNVVPCYALDGQWILLAFTELAIRPCVSDERLRGALCQTVLASGTLLLIANVLVGLWVLFAS